MPLQKEITKIVSNTAYNAYEAKLEKEVFKDEMPKHLAIIMDGNRRFARELGMEAGSGHVQGKQKLEEVIEWCHKAGIRILTMYAFSTENFSRSEDEVELLMEMFEENFRALGDDERVHKNHIRVKVLGDRELLPQGVKDSIEYVEARTKDYDEYYYNIAIAYGGRQEIVYALKQVAAKVKAGELEVDDIDEKVISQHMYTSHVPDPDLVLRTSGEVRISNFLLWQMAYSELYFTDIYWPGFRYIDFLRAVRSYQQRRRRYGK
jgi:tritrans,polycis-undecaprenyl-diphosphate synthase [geranylgeranyl-diphosphate specific]